MTFYDWAVIAIAVAFLIRGWRRGAIREAIDIALLLFGTIVVFRLSPMIGSIVSGMANVPYEVGRVVGGGLIFLVLVVLIVVAYVPFAGNGFLYDDYRLIVLEDAPSRAGDLSS